MKKYSKIFLSFFILTAGIGLLFLFFFVPSKICAAGLVPCDDDCNLCYLLIGISNIFQWLMGSLLTAIVLAGLTVAGVLYMLSGTFPKLLAFSKQLLTGSLKGFVLAMCGWLLVNSVMNIAGYTHPTGGNWYQFDCSTGSQSGKKCASEKKTLQSIKIQCASASGEKSASYITLDTLSGSGQSRTLKATGVYTCQNSDGTSQTTEEDITSKVSWKASDETQIKVASGVVTAVANSNSSNAPYVEASYQGKISNNTLVYINFCPDVETASLMVDKKYSFFEQSLFTSSAFAQTNTENCPECQESNSWNSEDCGSRIVLEIKRMSGWKYTQNYQGRTLEDFGDCSSTTSRAYTRAGCKNPGSATVFMKKNASIFSGDTSSLRKGDALIWNNGKYGHVGICLDDGCSQIMGASEKGGIMESNAGGQSMIAQAKKMGAKLQVMKVADFCDGASCMEASDNKNTQIYALMFGL